MHPVDSCAYDPHLCLIVSHMGIFVVRYYIWVILTNESLVASSHLIFEHKNNQFILLSDFIFTAKIGMGLP